MEDKLESGLCCELTDKLLYDGYVEYTLLYDMIANRISIEDVQAENGGLRLMKNLVWEYVALPHFLIFDEYVAFMECLNTKESKVIHGYASLCNASSEKKTSDKPVNTGYTDI